jgi:hypothetical protein
MYPPLSSVNVGLGCPLFGFDPMDFVTTAPAPDLNILIIDCPVSSITPDATIPGLSSLSFPTEVTSINIEPIYA